jgi:ABC-2 type transport system permease protein
MSTTLPELGGGASGRAAGVRFMSPLATDLAAVLALTRRDLLRFARDRSQLAGAIGRPFIWMVLFGSGFRHAAVGGAGDYRQFVYSGAIAMTILFGGMFQGITIVWDREFGMLREVLVAPISRFAIVVGKTCGGALVTLTQAVVAAAFAPMVGVNFGIVDGLCLLGAAALLSIGITALGVAVGSRMRTFEGFGVISNFVVLPLYFLSGGVFPPEGMPSWMRTLVMCNPVTYGVDLMRASIGQAHAFGVLLDAGMTGGFALGMCLVAFTAFRRASH